jgi:multisubunit Na+/H+ antiporter MnhC subunit
VETAGALPPRDPVGAERDWPRMDTPNVLWFFGAFAIAFATFGVIDKVPETSRDIWELLVALAFYWGYAIVGFVLLRRDWWVPGGLLFAVAVAIMPAVGYGVASLIGTFPKDTFFNPLQQQSWTIVLIGLVTMLDAVVSYAITRFPFLWFTFGVATQLTAQFFLPTVNSHPSVDAHLITAIVVGAALVAIGLVLDLARRRRDAFWFHVIGFFGVAVGLAYYASGATGDPDRGWVPTFIAGAIVLLLAPLLRRATWAVYGLIGLYAPLLHWLTDGVDANSLGYALILLAIGVSIFILGVVFHRYGRVWNDPRPRVEPPPPTPQPTAEAQASGNL